MNKKDSLDKQMLIRLTNDEYWQIKTACKHASMKQSDYLRHKLLSTSALSFLPSNDNSQCSPLRIHAHKNL